MNIVEAVEEIKRRVIHYRLLGRDASINASIISIQVNEARKRVAQAKQRQEIARLRLLQIEEKISKLITN